MERESPAGFRVIGAEVPSISEPPVPALAASGDAADGATSPTTTDPLAIALAGAPSAQDSPTLQEREATDDGAPLLSIRVPTDEGTSLSVKVPSDGAAPSLSIRVPAADDASPSLSIRVPADAGPKPAAVSPDSPEPDVRDRDTSKLVLERLVELAGGIEPATEGPARIGPAPVPDAGASLTSNAGTSVLPTGRDPELRPPPRRGMGLGLWATLILAGVAVAAVVGLRRPDPAATRPAPTRANVPGAATVEPGARAAAAPTVVGSSAGAGAPAAAPQGSGQAAEFAAAFGAAMDATATSIPVTVHVSPKGAVVLDHGKRLGTDVIVVNVEPKLPRHLVAIQEGYAPERFTLDGTLRSVSIELKKNVHGAPPKADPKPAPFDPASDVAGL